MARKIGRTGRPERLNNMPTAASGIEPAVEWLRRQGQRVIFTPSSCWHSAARGIFQAIPYHQLITPSEEELSQVFRGGRALALRYSAPLTSPVGKLSYHVAYSQPVYGLDYLSRQARQNVRKGLAHAVVEPVSFARLAHEGWALRVETLARQGRLKAENEAWWKRLCLSAEGLPGFEAWGASHKGELVAALIAFLAGDCFLMVYQQSLTAHLKYGVNNALAFIFTQQALTRPGVKKLFYGLESLDAPWEVDEFKLRMGYSLETVRQRVVFHPALRPLLKPVTLTALEYLGRKMHGLSNIVKAAGMIRFYLEGNRPLSEQECPPCLLAERVPCLRKAS